MKVKTNYGLAALLIVLCALIAVNLTMKFGGSTADTLRNNLNVHFLDVGQADCTLITDGRTAVMIDAGNQDDFEYIDSYLSSLGIGTVDMFIFTHPHEDHIGSGAKLIEKYGAGTVYMDDYDYSSSVYDGLKSAIKRSGCTHKTSKAEENIDFGSWRIYFLAPLKSYNNPNNDSIVIRLVCGDISFIFTGDAEREAELDIVQEYGSNLESTVLKVGHHGGATSTSYVFLRSVSPKYAVISCGRLNKYGHPDESVLSRLRDADCMVFRTDLSGTITAECDGETVNFNVSDEKAA